MVHIEILKSRDEWLKARSNRIGGSDAASIVGLNPFMSNTELWDIKKGIKQQEDISEKPYVKYGTIAEHLLRELFKMDYPDLEVGYKENNLFLNDKYPFAHASLDGWLRDSDGRKGVWECKTTEILNSTMSKKWEGEHIPDNYYTQLLHQLMVTGFDFAILKAQLKYNYEGSEVFLKTKHYRLERSDVEEDIEYLISEEQKFWKSLQDGIRPPRILPSI